MRGRPWAMPSTRPAGAEPYNPERPAASARQQEDLTTLGVPPGCRCCALARHIQLTHASGVLACSGRFTTASARMPSPRTVARQQRGTTRASRLAPTPASFIPLRPSVNDPHRAWAASQCKS